MTPPTIAKPPIHLEDLLITVYWHRHDGGTHHQAWNMVCRKVVKGLSDRTTDAELVAYIESRIAARRLTRCPHKPCPICKKRGKP